MQTLGQVDFDEGVPKQFASATGEAQSGTVDPKSLASPNTLTGKRISPPEPISRDTSIDMDSQHRQEDDRRSPRAWRLLMEDYIAAQKEAETNRFNSIRELARGRKKQPHRLADRNMAAIVDNDIRRAMDRLHRNIVQVDAKAAISEVLERRGLVTEIHTLAPALLQAQNSVPLQHQANLDLHTPENMKKRQELKHSPEILRAIDQCWDALPKTTPSGSISFPIYVWFNRKLAAALTPDATSNEFLATVTEDWNTDSRGKDLMVKQDFTKAMFTLVDLWSESVESDEYVAFLDSCREVVTLPPSYQGTLEESEEMALRTKPLRSGSLSFLAPTGGSSSPRGPGARAMSPSGPSLSQLARRNTHGAMGMELNNARAGSLSPIGRRKGLNLQGLGDNSPKDAFIAFQSPCSSPLPQDLQLGRFSPELNIDDIETDEDGLKPTATEVFQATLTELQREMSDNFAQVAVLLAAAFDQQSLQEEAEIESLFDSYFARLPPGAVTKTQILSGSQASSPTKDDRRSQKVPQEGALAGTSEEEATLRRLVLEFETLVRDQSRLRQERLESLMKSFRLSPVQGGNPAESHASMHTKKGARAEMSPPLQAIASPRASLKKKKEPATTAEDLSLAPTGPKNDSLSKPPPSLLDEWKQDAENARQNRASIRLRLMKLFHGRIEAESGELGPKDSPDGILLTKHKQRSVALQITVSNVRDDEAVDELALCCDLMKPLFVARQEEQDRLNSEAQLSARDGENQNSSGGIPTALSERLKSENAASRERLQDALRHVKISVERCKLRAEAMLETHHQHEEQRLADEMECLVSDVLLPASGTRAFIQASNARDEAKRRHIEEKRALSEILSAVNLRLDEKTSLFSEYMDTLEAEARAFDSAENLQDGVAATEDRRSFEDDLIEGSGSPGDGNVDPLEATVKANPKAPRSSAMILSWAELIDTLLNRTVRWQAQQLSELHSLNTAWRSTVWSHLDTLADEQDRREIDAHDLLVKSLLEKLKSAKEAEHRTDRAELHLAAAKLRKQEALLVAAKADWDQEKALRLERLNRRGQLRKNQITVLFGRTQEIFDVISQSAKHLQSLHWTKLQLARGVSSGDSTPLPLSSPYRGHSPTRGRANEAGSPRSSGVGEGIIGRRANSVSTGEGSPVHRRRSTAVLGGYAERQGIPVRASYCDGPSGGSLDSEALQQERIAQQQRHAARVRYLREQERLLKEKEKENNALTALRQQRTEVSREFHSPTRSVSGTFSPLQKQQSFTSSQPWSRASATLGVELQRLNQAQERTELEVERMARGRLGIRAYMAERRERAGQAERQCGSPRPARAVGSNAWSRSPSLGSGSDNDCEVPQFNQVLHLGSVHHDDASPPPTAVLPTTAPRNPLVGPEAEKEALSPRKKSLKLGAAQLCFNQDQAGKGRVLKPEEDTPSPRQSPVRTVLTKRQGPQSPTRKYEGILLREVSEPPSVQKEDTSSAKPTVGESAPLNPRDQAIVRPQQEGTKARSAPLNTSEGLLSRPEIPQNLPTLSLDDIRSFITEFGDGNGLIALEALAEAVGEDIDALRSVFDELDSDHDGKLTMDEFLKLTLM
jgi:hypothetical protein